MLRHYIPACLLFLLVFVSVNPAFAIPIPASAQASSCPSNQILRLALSPIPNSFNLLTAAGDSSYATNAIEQMGVYPFPLILKNGSFWWNDVVTDWVKSNSNYTQWTFNVKPGLKWSDGTNVSAQDIINNFGTPGKMAANSTYDFVGLSSELVRSYALNSSAAVIDLNTSDAHFGERISMYYYTNLEPPQDVSAGPGANYFGTDVGSGPFYNSNYLSGATTLVMKRNPYFNNPAPAACEVDVNFVENSAAYTQFLVSGQVDAAGAIPYASMPSLNNIPFLHFSTVKGWLGTRIEYNVLHYPYNMTSFRQALAFGINDSAVVQQALLGYGVPASDAQGEIPDTYTSYNSNQLTYSYDPAKATSLLQSIGITKGSDGFLHYSNGTIASLTLWTDTNKAWDVDVANAIVGDLTSLGFKINTQTTSTSNLVGDFSTNAFGIQNDMVVYTSGGPFFPDTWLDVQIPCSVYGVPGCYPDNPTGYPPDAVADYQSNLTAVDSTNNLTQEQVYVNNIQAINAKYLPQLMIAYPDVIYAYNTQRWTNWPQSPSFLGYSSYINATALAAVVPVGASSTTSSVTASAPNPTTTSSASTSAAPPIVTSAASSTSSTTSVGTNPFVLAAGVVVAIVVIGGLAAYALRRRK